MNGNCYTYPLILPEVSIKDPDIENAVHSKATLLNCLDYALIYDDESAKDFEIATLRAIDEHPKAALEALE